MPLVLGCRCARGLNYSQPGLRGVRSLIFRGQEIVDPTDMMTQQMQMGLGMEPGKAIQAQAQNLELVRGRPPPSRLGLPRVGSREGPHLIRTPHVQMATTT